MSNQLKFNDIYLSLQIRKSQEEKKDEHGNFIFEVEASNENVDLQDQVVLQNALIESKEEFLKNGVISLDHLHRRKNEDGTVTVDNSKIIGEPIDVKFDTKTKSTVVVGKLYKDNPEAEKIINLLKSGSTRVKASVGGIFPEIVKNAKTGVEKVIHVLWNDLALTVNPVNNTVSNAVFAKSMTSAEFVDFLPEEIKKSLCAGYGTDSNEMSGGRAIIKEDVEKKVNDTTVEKSNDTVDETLAIQQLIDLAKRGRINGEKDAIDFLMSKGLSKEKAGEITSEIIKQGRQVMKKSFSNAVSELLKSLTGKKEDEEDINKGRDKDEDVDDIDLGNGEDENTGDEDDADGEDTEEPEEEPDDNSDDDQMVDGSKLLKSLDYELSEMRKSMKVLRKQNEDLGKAVVDLAQMVYAIGNEKNPPRSTMAKSMNGNSVQNKGSREGRPTLEEFTKVQSILTKAVAAGEISLQKSTMIESEVQRVMQLGGKMSDETYKFICSKMKEV